MEFPKIKINLPYDPAALLPSTQPEETKPTPEETPVLPCSLQHTDNGQDMETTQVSISGRTDKGEVVRGCNGILFSHKRRQPWVCNDVGGPQGVVLKEEVRQRTDSVGSRSHGELDEQS